MTFGMALSMSIDNDGGAVVAEAPGIPDETHFFGSPVDDSLVCATDPFDDFDDDDFDDEFDDDFEEEWDDELPGGDNYDSEDADKDDADDFDDDAEFEDEE
jgi:hypothetical protein